MTFDERSFLLNRQQQIIDDFRLEILRIDRSLRSKAVSKGWKAFKTAERTVVFTFGIVTFSRYAYRDKQGKVRYPVDEELGLVPYIRYSREVLFDLATLATEMSYRKVALFYSELKHIEITKDTVAKAVKLAAQLYKEKSEYRIAHKSVDNSLRKVKRLYIEGDGVLFKTPVKNHRNLQEISHFVVHEGVQCEKTKRKKLKNKREFIATGAGQARKQVIDYIFNHYEFMDNAVIVTNSDMGKGYSKQSFKEITDVFPVTHHHFWDRYHLNQRIKKIFDGELLPLRDKLFETIKKREPKKVDTIFDTAESMIEDEQKLADLLAFRVKFKKHFSNTEPAKLRGYSFDGIGVIESNNAKLSFRMKHRGMFWTLNGAVTMAKMIIDQDSGQLRDLFFGKWREKYEKWQKIVRQENKYLKNSSHLKVVRNFYKRTGTMKI